MIYYVIIMQPLGRLVYFIISDHPPVFLTSLPRAGTLSKRRETAELGFLKRGATCLFLELFSYFFIYNTIYS